MPTQTDVPSILKEAWGQLMRQRHFNAAASIGVLAWLLAEKDGEHQSELRDGGIAFVRSAVSGADQKSESSNACSFCGKAPPEVRIVRGADGAICNECVVVATEVFSRPD